MLGILALFMALQYTVPFHTGANTVYVAPTFVASAGSSSGASSVSSITSASFTAGAADIVFVKCRSSASTLAFTSTISSSGMTPFATTQQITTGGSGQGISQMFVFYHPPSGSFTVTCTGGVAATFMGIVVLQFTGGSLTAVDFAGGSAGPSGILSPTSSPVTSTFSTTAKGLIVACFDAPFNAVSTTAGLIGSTTATLTPTYAAAGNDVGCEYTIPTGAQTTITAAMSAGASGNWQWHVSPWK